MKKNLHRLLLTVTAIAALSSAEAKIWKVSNITGANADFTQVQAAGVSAAVQPGDTLYVEGSPTSYSGSDLKKRLVIIGPGYFLSGNNSNPGLQYNGYPATVTIYIDSTASGSVITGMSGNLYLYYHTDDVTFTRNDATISGYSSHAGSKASNIKITRNFGGVSFSNIVLENLECTNNILSQYCDLSSTANTNGLFRNNVILNTNASISGAYVSNNIFSVWGITFNNCTVKYNINTGNQLPAGNNNRNNISLASLFVTGGSTDGAYKLSATSPALAAGEPINGVTPDAGAYGTADPYRLSGIPAIPTIYQLTVPASVPSSATTMTVTISTRSNN
ncbi:MAG: hypothetical protein ABW007_02570 [Chitinophagaceae bacterium]